MSDISNEDLATYMWLFHRLQLGTAKPKEYPKDARWPDLIPVEHKMRAAYEKYVERVYRYFLSKIERAGENVSMFDEEDYEDDMIDDFEMWLAMAATLASRKGESATGKSLPEDFWTLLADEMTRIATSEGKYESTRMFDHFKSAYDEGFGSGMRGNDLRQFMLEARESYLLHVQSYSTNEINEVANRVQIEAFRELGVEEYDILTAEDACEECLDYASDTYRVGWGPLPPFHPYCRCWTEPHEGRGEGGEE